MADLMNVRKQKFVDLQAAGNERIREDQLDLRSQSGIPASHFFLIPCRVPCSQATEVSQKGAVPNGEHCK
jgi:hypothetical protein